MVEAASEESLASTAAGPAAADRPIPFAAGPALAPAGSVALLTAVGLAFYWLPPSPVRETVALALALAGQPMRAREVHGVPRLRRSAAEGTRFVRLRRGMHPLARNTPEGAHGLLAGHGDPDEPVGRGDSHGRQVDGDSLRTARDRVDPG
jgi:hypothetical protein